MVCFEWNGLFWTVGLERTMLFSLGWFFATRSYGLENNFSQKIVFNLE